jgi:hypothetical protein
MCLFSNPVKAFILLVFGALFLGSSCKSTTAQEKQQKQAKEIALEKLGATIDEYPNSTGSHTLFVQRENPTNTPFRLKFMVIKIAISLVVLEDSFAPGYIKWVSESTLEILSVPGTIRENEDMRNYTKTIDIHSSKQ